MKKIYHKLIVAAMFLLSASPSFAQSVEYFWDNDPGVGYGTKLGDIADTGGSITANLDASKLAVGVHRLGLRALNDSLFSQTYYRSFYVPPKVEKVYRIEYSWDKAAALGQGESLNFTPGNAIDLTEKLSTVSLSAGMHTLYIQALTEDHHSSTYSRSFYVIPTPHAVKAIEYFFDTDPGVGHATQMAAATTGDSLKMAFSIDTEGLEDGVHHIGIRTLTDGTWSSTYYRQFLVSSTVDNYITRVEYFWNDDDPGYGKAHTVDITPGEEVTVDFEADMTSLGKGPHRLGLRAQTGSQGWSNNYFVTDIPFEGWDALQEYLNSLRDTEDSFNGSVYTRQFLNLNWHALYVPFSLKYSDWAAHFDVARINAFYQYDDDEDGVVDRQVLEAIIMQPNNGSLRPNYPYLIRAKEVGTYSFNVDASTVVPQQINSVSCSTLEAQYTFTGNYKDMDGLKSADIYRLQGSSLSIPNKDDEVLPPYRWYLNVDNLGNQLNASAKKMQIRIKDDATGINETTVCNNDELPGERKVYDMSGRRIDIKAGVPLSTLPKGVYIANNMKIIIK